MGKLAGIIEGLSDKERIDLAKKLRTVIDGPPSNEEFDTYISEACAFLLHTLRKRAVQYGEEALFNTSENGIYDKSAAKLNKVKRSMNLHFKFEDRFDDWLDLAGYAILAIAMADFNGQVDNESPEIPEEWKR